MLGQNRSYDIAFPDLGLGSPMLFQNRKEWHVLFWFSFFIYEGLIWGMVDGEYSRRMITSGMELPVKIIATYFTLYILIDKLLIRRRYFLFLITLLLSMALFGIIIRILAYYTIYPMYNPDALTINLFFPPKILIGIFSIYSIVAIVASFHLIKIWFRHQQANQLLEQKAQQFENEKLAGEIKLLKSQINPHFLFNTLNNLYVLTLNNSEKSPEMIYKLSELMSYMLYESNKTTVPLKKEVQYIENYISLEKLRYAERLDVSMNIYDSIEGINIAPLLILPFVENSFKHGISNQIVSCWIRIDISVQKGLLVIKVENSKGDPEKRETMQFSSGIGLQNLTKRLQLIYPNRHSLKVFDEEDTYLSILKVTLSEHPESSRNNVHKGKPVVV